MYHFWSIFTIFTPFLTLFTPFSSFLPHFCHFFLTFLTFPSFPLDFDSRVTMLASACFLFSNFQFIFIALAFCQSYSLYRQPIYRHVAVTLLFLFLFTLCTLLILVEWPNFADAFSLIYPPFSFRIRAYVIALINGIIFMLYERICVPHESDDEEPVGDMKRLLGAIEEFGGKRGEEFGGKEEERVWFDRQLTLLPKMRGGAPVYYQMQVCAAVVWSPVVVADRT